MRRYPIVTGILIGFVVAVILVQVLLLTAPLPK